MTEETTVTPVPVTVPAPEPAPEPAAAPQPVSAPVTDPASAPANSGKGRKATGILGQVVGIVGVVVCLALVVGVLLGRGWATGAVSDVASKVDATVARTQPLLDRAGSAVDEVAARAGEAAAAADAVSVDPNAAPQALQGILDKVSAVSERYLELRSTYASAREQIVSALDRLAIIDRLVPGVSVPQGPIDLLASLDQKAQALDGRVMDLIKAGTAVSTVNTAAAAIAEKARAVQDGLGTVATGIDDVQARLAGLRSELATTTDTINGVITAGCVVLILVLLYLALLHFVLFRFSRERAGVPAPA